MQTKHPRFDSETNSELARYARMMACSAILMLGLMAWNHGAAAVPIDSDLDITGSVNMSRNLSTGSVTQSGSTRVIEGGVTTSSGFTTSPPGTNPLTGTFTDTGDGIGFTTDLDAGPTSEFDFIIDLGFNLANNSATDTFTITVKVNLNALVDVDGADSYAESKLDVELDTVDQVTSDIASDTAFGDSKNGAALGTFGDPVSDIFMTFFNVVLAPGATALIGDHHQWEGGVFLTPGSSLVDISLDITIDSIACSGPNCVTTPPGPDPIPEPATLTLFAVGLGGLSLLRRRQRRGQTRLIEPISADE